MTRRWQVSNPGTVTDPVGVCVTEVGSRPGRRIGVLVYVGIGESSTDLSDDAYRDTQRRATERIAERLNAAGES